MTKQEDFICISEVVTMAEKEMDEFIESKVIDHMRDVSMQIGINVNKEKLSKWLQMCFYLETLPEKEKLDIGARAMIDRLLRKTKKLEVEIEILLHRLRRLSDD